MKVKKLEIKNLRKISDVNLEFDKPLICLYGEVQQGKTTFLDAIKILFSSGFPSDLIQHGKEEAEIKLTLENGVISRSFYMNKENEIKGRPLNAIVENQKISAKDLQRLFNPFQLNQDFLKEMSPTERKKYFVDLFNVDTTEIDKLISKKESKAKDLRIEIKSFGAIEIEKVEKPDLAGLQQKEIVEKAKLNTKVLENREFNMELKKKWQLENQNHLQEIQQFNQKQRELRQFIENKKTALSELEATAKKYDVWSYILNDELAEYIDSGIKKPQKEKPLTNLPEPEYIDEKEGCDTTELEKIQAEISDAKANQIKYENYLKELAKAKEKMEKEAELKDTEAEIRELRKQKISKLAEYGKEIEGLQFNENGELND
jgi:DNA repair ATPase RecN